jgi:hypothetical protein
MMIVKYNNNRTKATFAKAAEKSKEEVFVHFPSSLFFEAQTSRDDDDGKICCTKGMF